VLELCLLLSLLSGQVDGCLKGFGEALVAVRGGNLDLLPELRLLLRGIDGRNG
jgi:hypothetical protein